MISRSWKANWELVSPFLAFPPDLRRVVDTTNMIEALNRQIRKTIKTREQFPTDAAARKLLYLAIINAEKSWHQPTTGQPQAPHSRSTSETANPH
jgi:putative transposase